MYGGKQSCIQGFGGATCGKKSLGKPRSTKMLRRIFRKCDVKAQTGSIWFGIGTGGAHL
jgi:hypothetical protein